MKRKTRWLLFLTAFFPFYLQAQDARQNKNEYPQWSLRTLPSSFADADAGVMLGVNYRWSRKFSASFEPTWIFYSPVVRDDNSETLFPRGIKIRVDWRLHFQKKILRMETYVAPEFHFKHTRTWRWEQFGINCQNGSCAFFQQAEYREIKREIGGLIKAGMIKPITRNKRWLLEFYSGFGVKHMKFRETDLPPGGSFLFPPGRDFLERLFVTDDRNSFYYPMFPGGIKILFLLR